MAQDITVVLRRNMIKALAQGDLPVARTLLDRLDAADPLSVETSGLRLELLLREGRIEEAVVLAPTLLERFAGSARIHYLAGRLALRRKDHEEAIRRFQESLRIHRHWNTERLLGQALTHAGHLDEAEGVLSSLVAEHPEVHRDLAWLAERRGDLDLAVRHVERVLQDRPDDAAARDSLRRLKARGMEPAELQAEVETLQELGEEVPPTLVPEYVESLLRTGQGAKVRAFIDDLPADLDPRLVLRTAWASYRLQAFDLAVDLFLRAFPHVARDPKLLSALESGAGKSHRVPAVLEMYRLYAAEDRRLYGRIRTLSARWPE